MLLRLRVSACGIPAPAHIRFDLRSIQNAQGMFRLFEANPRSQFEVLNRFCVDKLNFSFVDSESNLGLTLSCASVLLFRALVLNG